MLGASFEWLCAFFCEQLEYHTAPKDKSFRLFGPGASCGPEMQLQAHFFGSALGNGELEARQSRVLHGSFRCQWPLERWPRAIPTKELPCSISALELTSPGPLRPGADDAPPRCNRAQRAARRQQRLSDLARRGPPLREVSAVGRVVTVDRQDGERTRLTKNPARYEHALAHDMWVSFETALPQEPFAPREPASNPRSRMANHPSPLKATLFAPPNHRLGTLLSPVAIRDIAGPGF